MPENTQSATVNEGNEQQVRRWISRLCFAASGAIVTAAPLLTDDKTGALVFPTCLLLSGGALAGLALLLGWEAEKIEAAHRAYRRPAGFVATSRSSETSQLRSLSTLLSILASRVRLVHAGAPTRHRRSRFFDTEAYGS